MFIKFNAVDGEYVILFTMRNVLLVKQISYSMLKHPRSYTCIFQSVTLLLFGINTIVLKQIMYRLMHVFAPVPI